MVDDEAAEMVQLEHIHGIKKSHVKKLKKAGIVTAKMLAECTPTKVRSIIRISEIVYTLGGLGRCQQVVSLGIECR